MIGVVVRSKRDADAFKAMARIFYRDWELEIYTLHGARDKTRAIEELEDIIDNKRFYIILLGREDKTLAEELEEIIPWNAAVHVVPRARVRNTRMEHLAHEFAVARSKIRLSISWLKDKNMFSLDHRIGEPLEGYTVNPAYDTFIMLGPGSKKVLEEIIENNICLNPLLVRMFGGEHRLYCGSSITAIIEVPDEGLNIRTRLYTKPETTYIELDKLVRENKDIINLYTGISKEFLNRYREWADKIVVPWSGGKDSTAALLLALEVFPRSKIEVINVDTGAEFPCTRQYVDKLAQMLRIEVHRVYAGIDKGILYDGMPMPTHENRWCTGWKIDALEKAIDEIGGRGNVLVVTGDRDAESKARSIRPPSRSTNTMRRTVSPIKMWGTIHTQLYLLKKNIPLNPLYLHGFYRIGCYICPALRSLEKRIILSVEEINKELRDKLLFKVWLEKSLNYTDTTFFS